MILRPWWVLVCLCSEYLCLAVLQYLLGERSACSPIGCRLGLIANPWRSKRPLCFTCEQGLYPEMLGWKYPAVYLYEAPFTWRDALAIGGAAQGGRVMLVGSVKRCSGWISTGRFEPCANSSCLTGLDTSCTLSMLPDPAVCMSLSWPPRGNKHSRFFPFQEGHYVEVLPWRSLGWRFQHARWRFSTFSWGVGR